MDKCSLDDKATKAVKSQISLIEQDPPLGQTNNESNDLKDDLNDSALFISSNWSTGPGGCKNYTEFFSNDIEVEQDIQMIDKHVLKDKIEIPKLDLVGA
jgi:hypothetical protein